MKRTLAALLLAVSPLAAAAQGADFARSADVTWNSLGTNENDSMPLGNGDMALNAWTEQNGDIVLLLAKADAWSENGQMLKLGQARVKLTPNPFAGAADFAQTLHLEDGSIVFQAGGNSVRLWVDANHPVVHVEIEAGQPVALEAKAEPWRLHPHHLDSRAVGREGFFEFGNDPDGLDFDADTILPARDAMAAVCHFNTHSIYPLVLEKEHLAALLPKYPDPLMHRCFGFGMRGPDLATDRDLSLRSVAPAREQRLDIFALTEQTDSPDSWRKDLASVAASADATKLKTAWKAHAKWWDEFWNRSWIHVSGDARADAVSQSYAIQRFMNACAGRGAQPIKFNGSIFTVGHALAEGQRSSERNHDPDYRAWGASYWNQNNRHVYWPMLAAGDFDLLAPWFDMYVRALPLAEDRTRQYFHHDGVAFIETMYFWGLPNINDFGWRNSSVELDSPWMRYHIQGALEVIAQMLDRYDYMLDTEFARQSLLPMANAVVTYYDEHWQRGPDGKILMSPSQSIETYQVDAVNPTPDIAGLNSILPRLLALPSSLGSGADRALWSKVLHDLPAVPMGTTAQGKIPHHGLGDSDGRAVILPASKYGDTKNHENPELYTVFPYHLYGVGKPDLTLARDTFAARLFPFDICWGQDGEEAALLGLTDKAAEVVHREFTSYGGQRFKWFWSKNSDWIPDMDNGGAGMETLQLMLLQTDGKRLLLLPAWPANWTADFKLHGPLQTTVEGHVENGKLSGLKVAPRARAKDVEIMR